MAPLPYLHVRKVHALRWEWSITDGPVGPPMIGPRHACTSRAAYRRASKALAALEARVQ